MLAGTAVGDKDLPSCVLWWFRSAVIRLASEGVKEVRREGGKAKDVISLFRSYLHYLQQKVVSMLRLFMPNTGDVLCTSCPEPCLSRELVSKFDCMLLFNGTVHFGMSTR